MNSTTSNAMSDAAPEMPNVDLSAIASAEAEARPVPQETDTSDRLRLEHPGAKLGWSDGGGMVEQQSSALEWVEAAGEARISERAAMEEGTAAIEMTDSRQAAQYSRWTGEPLGETAGVTQSAGIGQSH
jgi:hypothetical protein